MHGKTHRILRLLLLSALTIALGWADPPAAPLTVTGTVRGPSGPITGAQVAVVGSNVGAVTDGRGRYSISLPGTYVGTTVELRAVVIGYASEIRRVVLGTEDQVVDFTLSPSSLQLEGVVSSAEAGAPALDSSARWRAVAPAQAPRHVRHPHGGRGRFNTESYAFIEENRFLTTAANPLSTFSIDVDRASYANVRRFIESGMRPPVDAVRIEELINYFTYDYPAPRGEHPFSVHTEVARAPWQAEHLLLKVGLQGVTVDLADAPPNNLVFLIDVSGSMRSPDKLPLLKRAMGMLVDQLRPRDRVAIVVYAGAAGLVLPSTEGAHARRIMAALEDLEAGGSTAGGAGIELAYRVARESYIEGGNNRVILATDGDFNVGASSDAEMVRLIERKRSQGTYLTVLGFGTGNLKDSKMEQLADHGNGNFAYIDGPLEARKVLVEELGGTLLTIAKDVKLQLEFNPRRVAAYRLIGYENRVLAAEDFDDDRKDAGELGAGHSVTALYELVPAGSDGAPPEPTLRYGDREAPSAERGEELLYVKLRYKRPDADRSRLLTHVVPASVGEASADFRFAAAVAAFGMTLRNSEHRGDFELAEVAELASGALGDDPRGYRADFLRLVREAALIEDRHASSR